MRKTVRDEIWGVAAVVLFASGCAGEGGPETDSGRLTVLLGAEFAGSWPTGLDPATSTTGTANLSIMNAIFGGLLQLTADEDGGNPRIVGDLARGYELRDQGRTLEIRLREGVLFSDGTPLDAEAVRFNIERNLESHCVCAPTAWPWAETPVSTPSAHTVVLHFTRSYPAAVNAFPTSNVNWIVSPTALREQGDERFRITPVGAGPFRVVSNELSSRLVLERNPRYWREGRPYLERIVFLSIGSEQAGYQALLAGDAHVYEGMSNTSIIEHAKQSGRFTVTMQPPTSPYVVQLNTSKAPFDQQRAREAIYHATDVEAIRLGIFRGWYPVSQTFTGPGGLFHRDEIPGYRAFDPERARAIVEELGGLRITLGTLRSAVADQVVTALQTQWQRAGIEVEIETYELATLVREFQAGQWQAMLQTVGSYDPESITGVSSRFRSDRPFTGVRDARLDAILMAAAAAVDSGERGELYFEAGRHISDNAYAPFLFAFAPTQVVVAGVHGPGLTTKIPPMLINTGVWWQEVRRVSR